MKNELSLTKVEAWAIHALIDDRRTGTKGYYKDPAIAAIDAVGAGINGEDGTVDPISLYEDTDGDIYYVEQAGNGKYKDVQRANKKVVIDSIKTKLTQEELDVLGLT